MFKTLENDAKSIDKPITPTIKATIAITFAFYFFPFAYHPMLIIVA